MLFEVHITGEEAIHDVAKKFGHKTIAVELLRPDLSVIRVEHMTSIVLNAATYTGVLLATLDIKGKYKTSGLRMWRTKIECPYNDYFLSEALYIESHFEVKQQTIYPVSRNTKKTTLLATDREYYRTKFAAFNEKYASQKGVIVELCIFDSFVLEDEDWFECYNMVTEQVWSLH